ncbi:MAG: hypothetical protein QG610_2275 [Euryarchaeota archaeon]|nr:hypothetical protein [Euryarchaeota archaeon]
MQEHEIRMYQGGHIFDQRIAVYPKKGFYESVVINMITFIY